MTDTSELQKLVPAAIKATEYKYFGDYEMSDDQRKAVDTLVAAAQSYIEQQATISRLTAERAALSEMIGSMAHVVDWAADESTGDDRKAMLDLARRARAMVRDGGGAHE